MRGGHCFLHFATQNIQKCENQLVEDQIVDKKNQNFKIIQPTNLQTQMKFLGTFRIGSSSSSYAILLHWTIGGGNTSHKKTNISSKIAKSLSNAIRCWPLRRQAWIDAPVINTIMHIITYLSCITDLYFKIYQKPKKLVSNLYMHKHRGQHLLV
jgi:hypothetical protein